MRVPMNSAPLLNKETGRERPVSAFMHDAMTFVATTLALGAAATPGIAATPLDYAARIAPLFQEHCIDCHGNDDPDGEFNLETFESLMKGGKDGKAIIAGNAQESRLVKFLEGRSGKTGKNQFMPPGKKEHLKPEEIALIRQWIDAGAPAPAAEKKPAELIASLPKIAPKGEPKKAINSLAFTPKGGLLAEGLFGSVRLLDAATQRVVRTLPEVAGKVNALIFSADGTMLFAAAGDAGLNGIAYHWRVSDPATAGLVRKFEGHTDAIYALALSPDGRMLATGSYDQKIRLWSTTTGAELKMLKGHNGGVFGLSFRKDGKVLASASGDRTIKLWDVATGNRLDTFSQPLKEQFVVVFAPDGKTVAAAGADSRIRIWNVTKKALEGSNKILLTRYAHEGALLNLVFSNDGKTFVSSASDRTVKIWNAATLTELQLLEKQTDWTPGLAFVADNKLALGRLDGTLAFYNASTGAPETGTGTANPGGSAPAAKPATAAAKKKAAGKMPAPQGKPELTRLEPRGVQSGSTTMVKVTGKNLAAIKEIKFSDKRLSAKATQDDKGVSATLDITAAKDVPRTQVKITLVTDKGESAPQTLQVDDLPQIVAAKSAQPASLSALPLNVWGTLLETGQQDGFRFAAKSGQMIILDLAAKRIESKMISPRLEVFDATGKLLVANNGLDSGSDPFIAFSPPRDGEFSARVREITLEGSPNHFYRLTIGELPYVTGWWPLAVPPDRESTIHLVGLNLPKDHIAVKAGAQGEITLPLDGAELRSRVAAKVSVSDLPLVDEAEPNDATAQPIAIPSSINGRLFNEKNPEEADVDHFRFEAEKGRQLIIETRAAMPGSPADTKIEVLDSKGAPVPMMQMQATKDSWITLRSEDANDPAIRLGQFAEMELNDFMYYNGEVLKIFRLARGPDADMVYYANGGKRRAYFNTSPAAHGLDDVCYVVEPKPAGAKLVPNGLPVFTLNYSNDDDGERELGRDSRLVFRAPAKGSYRVRVTDTRGWSGDRFAYRLIVRNPKPDCTVKLRTTPEVNVPAGSGVQFTITADRMDGFDGDVRVEIAGVPQDFFVSSPLVIQAGHLDAAGCLYARPDVKPGTHDFSKVKLVAKATVNGQEVKRDVPGFPKVNVAAATKKILFMEPDVAGKPAGDGKSAPPSPYEITIAPGATVSAWLRVDRRGDDALIACDVENLPHGVIVDNIGLNGVQIRAGESEREIFLTCAKWVPEQDRLCQVIAGSARNDAAREIGTQAGFPVLLKVRKPQPVVVK